MVAANSMVVINNLNTLPDWVVAGLGIVIGMVFFWVLAPVIINLFRKQ